MDVERGTGKPPTKSLFRIRSYREVCSVIADRLVLYPSKRLIDPLGAIPRTIPGSGAIAGTAVSIYVAQSPGCEGLEPKVFDLEFSGNGSRAEKFTSQAAEQWGPYPVEVWGVNYPGFGASTGSPSLSTLAPSALVAFDAVAKEAAGRPIVLGCHSIGCAVGLYVATQRPVAGVILLNPPPLRQLIVGHYGWWNLWLGARLIAAQIPPELDSLANAAKATAPALFFSARNDTIVPQRFHQMVFDRYAGPKRVISLPDSGHNNFPDPADPAVQAAMEWFYRLSSGPNAMTTFPADTAPAPSAGNSVDTGGI